MRHLQLIVLVAASGILIVPNACPAAAGKRMVRQPAAQQSSAMPVAAEEQRKATKAAQVASIEEQKMTQRVRWVELQLKREQQLLSQRLAYANRLRAAGLQKNDEKVLKQAEQYERQALAAFEQKVSQYEKMLQTTTPAASPATSQRTSRSTTRKNTTTRMRSTAKPHPQSRLVRRR